MFRGKSLKMEWQPGNPVLIEAIAFRLPG